MENAREITIAIDDSFTQPVCDHSVGFLRIVKDGKSETAMPCGTGTFVRLGNVYGILTAAHALKPMDENEVVGLVRFPGVKPALQNFRLDLSLTERFSIWNETDGDAPDIAFLKIPQVEGRNLEAVGAVFYNLGLPREFKPSKPSHKMSKCYAVVGVVGEWTEESLIDGGKKKKVDVGGLFGGAKTTRDFKEGDTDLVEVQVDHAGPRIPNSYEGISGGGLWELHAELDEQLKVVEVKKRLHGVAFRQSEDCKRIVSNAAPSIDAVKAEIEEKWPIEVGA